MTNYQLKPPQDQLPPPSWLVAKEKRRKQLAAVRNRRRLMYELMQKMQLKPSRQ